MSVVYKMGVEHIVLTIRGALCEGMWQFVFSHAVTVQACTSVERFRGVDPSVYYPEIRPLLIDSL